MCLFFFFCVEGHTSVSKAFNVLSRKNTAYYPLAAAELRKSGLAFASIPYIKAYLSSFRRQSKIADREIERIIRIVGVRQFEVLPTHLLMNSKASIIRFILAKKYFRFNKYQKAIRELTYIPSHHVMRPFSLMLAGSAWSLLGNHKKAIDHYERCIGVSNEHLSREKGKTRRRQLQINRDTCIIGIPRTQFAAGVYEESHINYLNLPKSSFIWPEILFEEAWNSFYQRDYNRSLGKLVTYKAPVLKHIFNPEIDVLTALAFLELCLWNDVKLTVDRFYKKYHEESKKVDRYLVLHGKNYRHYFTLAKRFTGGERKGRNILERMLKDITRDGAYLELYDSFRRGVRETALLRRIRNSTHRSILKKNLKEAMVLQRDLIGAYVRKRIQLHQSQLEESLKGMSYIKLEALARKKETLYYPDKSNRKRGDVKYLKRNERQYFWNFNGEFWADEMGDYVFSLKSECSE